MRTNGVYFAVFAVAVLLLSAAQGVLANSDPVVIDVNNCPFGPISRSGNGEFNLIFNNISANISIVLKLDSGSETDYDLTKIGLGAGFFPSGINYVIISLNWTHNNLTNTINPLADITLEAFNLPAGESFSIEDDCFVHGTTVPGRFNASALTDEEKYYPYEARLSFAPGLNHSISLDTDVEMPFFSMTKGSISIFDVLNDDRMPDPIFPLNLPPETDGIVLRSKIPSQFTLNLTSSFIGQSWNPVLYNNWLNRPNIRLTNVTYDSYSPEVATGDNGEIYVTWKENIDGDDLVLFKKSDDFGVTWSNESYLWGFNGAIGDVVFDADGTSLVIAWESGSYVYVICSLDGGTSWSEPYTCAAAWDPSLVIDGSKIYLAHRSFRIGGPDIYMYIKLVMANTSMTEVSQYIFANPNGGEFAGIPDIEVNNGSVYVAIADFDSKNIYYWLSLDNGTNWEEPIILTQYTGEPDTGGIWLGQMQLIRNETRLMLLWSDARSGSYQIYQKYSEDEGITWSDDAQVTISQRNAILPNGALDDNGTLHAVWTEVEEYQGEQPAEGTVKYRAMEESGAFMTPELYLTDVITDSVNPDLSVDRNGCIHVVWQDYRNGNSEIYYLNAGSAAINGSNADVSSELNSPTAGEEVTLSATFSNDGDGDLFNVFVNFYILSEPTLIASIPVACFPAHTTKTFSITWIAELGYHTMVATVDSDTNLDNGLIAKIEHSIFVNQPPVAIIDVYQSYSITYELNQGDVDVDFSLLEEGVIISQTSLDADNDEATIELVCHLGHSYSLNISATGHSKTNMQLKIRIQLDNQVRTYVINKKINQGETYEDSLNLDPYIEQISQLCPSYTFDSHLSTDIDDGIRTTLWNIDDVLSIAPKFNYTFMHHGTHEVTLIVADHNGLTSQATITIQSLSSQPQAINPDVKDYHSYGIDGKGIVHAIGVFGGNKTVVYANNMVIDDQWSEEVIITNDGLVPRLCVDPHSNIIYVAWLSNTCPKQLFYTTSVDGVTWQEPKYIASMPQISATDMKLEITSEFLQVTVYQFGCGVNYYIRVDFDNDGIVDQNDIHPTEFDLNDNTSISGDASYTAPDGSVSVLIDYEDDNTTAPTVTSVVPSIPLAHSTGEYYDINAEGALTAYIKIKYNPATLPTNINEAALRLYHFDGSSWQICANPSIGDTTGVELETNTVWAKVHSLSVFTAADASLLDSDNDGLFDLWETEYGLGPNAANAPEEDPDGDGLVNSVEQYYGTSPINPDSDYDGLRDNEEIFNYWMLETIPINKKFFSPSSETYLNISDYPSDSNYMVFLNGTAHVNSTTAPLLQNALKLAGILSNGLNNTTLNQMTDIGTLTDNWVDIDISYSGIFNKNGFSELWLAANPENFDGRTYFKITLSTITYLKQGTDPNQANTYDIFLSDKMKSQSELGIWTYDTDGDNFWDSAEAVYWYTIEQLSWPEVWERVKCQDWDNDSLPDGAEVYLNTMPTVADYDEDGLNDFEEAGQFIPIFKKDIASRTQWFDISLPGEYSVKITTEVTTTNFDASYYEEYLTMGIFFASNNPQEVKAEFLANEIVSDNVLKISNSLDVIYKTKNNTNCAILSSNLTNLQFVNITSSRYYIVYLNLTPGSYFATFDATQALNTTSTITSIIVSKRWLDPFDPDMDGDGLSDGNETKLGSNPWSTDSDGDGLLDGEEVSGYGTHPAKPDTDEDRLLDGFNVNASTLSELQRKYYDSLEVITEVIDETLYYLGEQSLGTNSRSNDTDRDELEDGFEYEMRYDPIKWDTDNDTMPDGWEDGYGLSPTTPSDKDSDKDGDGLKNAQEYVLGTYPTIKDTDGDGIEDNNETISVKLRTNATEGAISSSGYGQPNTWIDAQIGTIPTRYMFSHSNNTFDQQYAGSGDSTQVVEVKAFDDGGVILARWEPVGNELNHTSQATASSNISFGTDNIIAQSFSVSGPEPVVSKIALGVYRKNASVNGTLNVEIREDNLNKPSSIIVTTGTANISLFPIVSGNLTQVMVSPVLLKPQRMYWLVISAPDSGKDNVSISSGGEQSYSFGEARMRRGQSTWWNPVKKDIVFKVGGYSGVDYTTIYIWKAGSRRTGELSGVCAQYNATLESVSPDLLRPAAGYRNMELYIGSDPTKMDTDGDGLKDGYERSIGTDPTNPDSDDDGVPDGREIELDGYPTNPDSDNDGIKDGHEPLWYQDIDGDGLIGMLDNDSDGDGLLDGPTIGGRLGEDLNGNGIIEAGETNPIDADTDSDGIRDWEEITVLGGGEMIDTDLDTLHNALDSDSDGDGLPDGKEVRVLFRTNAVNLVFGNQTWVEAMNNTAAWEEAPSPLLNWTLTTYLFVDYDQTTLGGTIMQNISNGIDLEIVFAPDGDLYIYNSTSWSHFTKGYSPNATNSSFPITSFTKNNQEYLAWISLSENKTIEYANVLNRDSDGDALLDGMEDANGNGLPGPGEANLFIPDTDGDGILDGDEIDWNIDTDGDGLINALDIDSDGDGLNDSHEMHNLGTSMVLYDTDADGLWDGYNITDRYGANRTGELSLETCPLDIDTDDDGLLDGYSTFIDGTLYLGELALGTKPSGPNSTDFDGDGLWDGQEVGLYYHNATSLNIVTDNMTGVKATNLSVFLNHSDADHGTTTDPTKIDTDFDDIPDGWIDGWNNGTKDGARQPWEGEDLSLNGKVDSWMGMNETSPNSLDSDRDGLNDSAETSFGTYWFYVDNQNNVSLITPLQNGTYSILVLVNATCEGTVTMTAPGNGMATVKPGIRWISIVDCLDITAYANITLFASPGVTIRRVLVSAPVLVLTNYSWYNLSIGETREITIPDGYYIEDASVEFTPVGRHDGNISGATWSSGKVGNAMVFDGVDDFVEIGDATSLNPTNALTIELWVNTSSTSTPAGWIPFVQKAFTSQVTPHYQYAVGYSGSYNNSYKLRFGVSINGIVQELETMQDSFIPDGRWHHIVATYNGTVLKIYLDGTEMANRTVTGNIDVFSTNLTIGGTPTFAGSNYHYNGLLDEVRILNRALTPEEIFQDYNATGRYPIRSNTTAWYTFDEANRSSPNTIYDLSGFNNLGTTYNVATIIPGGTVEVAFDNWQPIYGTLIDSTGTLGDNDDNIMTIRSKTYLENIKVWDDNTGTWTFVEVTRYRLGYIWKIAAPLNVDGIAENFRILLRGMSPDGVSIPFSWSKDGTNYNSLFSLSEISETEKISSYLTGIINGDTIYIKAIKSGEANSFDLSVDRLVIVYDRWTPTYSEGGCKVAVNGAALNFDSSDDYVSITGLTLPTEPNTKVTVEFWMYWKGGNNQMPFGWNTYDLWLYNNAFGFNSGAGDIYGISSIGLANRWVHVVAIFNNGDIKLSLLYIDSELQELSQMEGASIASMLVSSTCKISGWNNDNGYKFGGSIDEFRILNRSLSATEIMEDYNATGKYPMRNGTVVWYHFDEGENTTAKDSNYVQDLTLSIGNETVPIWANYGAFTETVTAEFMEDYFNQQVNKTTGVLSLSFGALYGGMLGYVIVYLRLAPIRTCPTAKDTDEDELTDWYEVNFYGTNPLSWDTDDDMLSDYWEIMGPTGTNPAMRDTDHDGLWDGFQDLNGNGIFDPCTEVGEDVNQNYVQDWDETHPRDPDTDNDGLVDGVERIPGVMWFEAENYSANSIYDPEANGDFATGNVYLPAIGDSNLLPVLEDGLWKLNVRVKGNYLDTPENALFYEDFSSGINGWQKYGFATASDGYLYLSGNSSNASWVYYPLPTQPSRNDYIVSFDYYWPPASPMSNFIVFGSYDGAEYDDIYIQQTNDKLYCYPDSAPFATISADFWHHFDLYMVSDGTYRIYIDERLVKSGIQINTGRMVRIGYIGDVSDNSAYYGSAFWDNFKIVESESVKIILTTSVEAKNETMDSAEDWELISPGNGAYAVINNGILEIFDNLTTDYARARPSTVTPIYYPEFVVSFNFRPGTGIIPANSFRIATLPFIVVFLEKNADEFLANVGGVYSILGSDANLWHLFQFYYYSNGTWLGYVDGECNWHGSWTVTISNMQVTFGSYPGFTTTSKLALGHGYWDDLVIINTVKSSKIEPLTTEYEWFSTPSFGTTTNRRWGIEIKGLSAGQLLVDRWMLANVPNGTMISDPLTWDTDADGLSDGQERGTYRCNPMVRDTDNDGLLDGIEAMPKVGTDPWNPDTEYDYLVDGDGAEIQVIFRTNATANSDGSLIFYKVGTWIAIPKLVEIHTITFADDFSSSLAQWTVGSGTYPYASWSILNGGLWQGAPNAGNTNIYTQAFDNDYSEDSVIEISWTMSGGQNIHCGIYIFASDPTQTNRGNAYFIWQAPAGLVLHKIENNIELPRSALFAILSTHATYNYLVRFDVKDRMLCIYRDGAFIGSWQDSPSSQTYRGRYLSFRTELSYMSADNVKVYTVGYIPMKQSNTLQAFTFVGTIPRSSITTQLGSPIYYKTPDNLMMYCNRASPPNVIWIENGPVCYEYRSSTISNYEPSYRPVLSYALADQEVYRNCAKTADADGDGIIDGLESAYGCSSRDRDSDDDGLADGYELFVLGTNPGKIDTDGDGVQDGTENGVTADMVQSGYWNSEVNMFIYGTNMNIFVPDSDPTKTTNPLLKDTDGDGLWDGWDGTNGEDIPTVRGQWGDGKVSDDTRESDPTNADSDGDMLKDGIDPAKRDADYDDDGLWDGPSVGNYTGEIVYGTLAYHADINKARDYDGDGLWDGQEVGLTSTKVKLNSAAYHGYTVWYTNPAQFKVDMDSATTTDPRNPDSDYDGLNDSQEEYTLVNGKRDPGETDPNNPDTDGDGLKDGYERNTLSTDPLDMDTDDDGLLDGPTLVIKGKRYIGEMQYSTDPTGVNSDKDGDLLPDHMEVGLYYITSEDKNILLDGENGVKATDYDKLPGERTSGKWGCWNDRGALRTRPDLNDTDLDGVLDKEEIDWGMDPCADDRGMDSDKDGLMNLVEYEYNRNHTTPGNPVFSAASTDTDADGIPDKVEHDFALAHESETDFDPLDPINGTGDYDHDGLANYDEMYTYPTNWTLADTDGDTLSDGTEFAMGTDPLDPDTDRDKILDGAEPKVVYRTNAIDIEGVPDFGNAWIALDDTGWTDNVWTLNGYIPASPCKVIHGENVSVAVDHIGSTPEGYNISKTASGISIIVNKTLNYTTGTWQIIEYKFQAGAGAILDSAPSQWFAINGTEVYGGLSPTSNDTDGDGLYDGPNVDYTYTLDKKNHQGEESVGTDPLNPDTDGDSANDGQELFGYDLVWMSINPDGTVKEHYVNGTTSDPLDAFNYGYDSRKGWSEYRDLDTDGISDYNETHYGDIYPAIVDWANQKRAEWVLEYPVWNNTWGRNSPYAFVWDIVSGDEDEIVIDLPTPLADITKGDFRKAHPEPQEFNATEYLSNQFNPFVKENNPPMITNVVIDTKESWGWTWYGYVCEHAWAEIDVSILDVAPYNLWIGVTDRGTYLFFSGSGGQYAQVHHAVIDLDYWGDVAAEYYVNVTAWDTAGNIAYYEKEVAGFFGGIMNFLEGVWNEMCNQFAQAWEKLKEAVNILYNIMVEAIMKIFRPLFEQVNTTVNNFFNGLLNLLGSSSDSSSTKMPPEHNILSSSNIMEINTIFDTGTAKNLADYVLGSQFMIVLFLILTGLEQFEKISRCNPLVWAVAIIIISLFILFMIKIINNMNEFVSPANGDRTYVPACTNLPEPENSVINAAIDVAGIMVAIQSFFLAKDKGKSGSGVNDLAWGIALAFASAMLSFASIASLNDFNPLAATLLLFGSIVILLTSTYYLIKGGLAEAFTAPFTFIFGLIGYSWSVIQIFFSYYELVNYINVYGW